MLGRADGGDGAGRGVGADVGEQVVDGPAQQLVVTDGLKAVGDVCLPGPVRVGDAGPLGAFGDEGGEVDQVALLAGMLVEDVYKRQEEGRGSTFKICLPLRPLPAPDTQDPDQSQAALA